MRRGGELAREDWLKHTLPAPPWVPAVVDGLASLLRPIDWYVIHAALDWCAAGEPAHRAEHLLTIVRLWPGPRGEIVSTFVSLATACRVGRSKTATTRRHVLAAFVFGSYEEQDATREENGWIDRKIVDYMVGAADDRHDAAADLAETFIRLRGRK